MPGLIGRNHPIERWYHRKATVGKVNSPTVLYQALGVRPLGHRHMPIQGVYVLHVQNQACLKLAHGDCTGHHATDVASVVDWI